MPDTFGKRLKAVREKRGLSTTQFCVKTGISLGQLLDYEKDYRRPSLQTLEWICQALGVTASELLGF